MVGVVVMEALVASATVVTVTVTVTVVTATATVTVTGLAVIRGMIAGVKGAAPDQGLQAGAKIRGT